MNEGFLVENEFVHSFLRDFSVIMEEICRNMYLQTGVLSICFYHTREKITVADFLDDFVVDQSCFYVMTSLT